MSPADVRAREGHARAYLMVAELVAEDPTIDSGTNMVGSLSVLAGVAASDAICGHTIRRLAVGDAHAEAIRLLIGATPPSSRAGSHLKRLLASKTDTQYSPILIGDSKAKELLTAAQRLVQEMDGILRA